MPSRTLATRTAVPVLTLLLAAAGVRAEAPDGSYSVIGIGGNDAILTIGPIEADPPEECRRDSEVGQLCVDAQSAFSLAVDGSGEVSGDASIRFQASADSIGSLGGALAGSVRGKLKRASGGALLEVKLSIEGPIDTPFGDTDGKLTGSLKGKIDDEGNFVGTEKLSLKIKSLGSRKVKLDVEDRFEGPFTWNLDLDVLDLGGGKLGGTARAELANGQGFQYRIEGEYNEKRDSSTLKLEPDENAKGTSLKIQRFKTEGDEVVGASIKYKLAGQSGALHVESQP